MRAIDTILEVENLTAKIGERIILDNVSFAIPKGSLCAIIGPNGAGKSTLLKAMLQMIPSDYQSITALGKNIRSTRKQIAYVPQKESVDWDFPIDAYHVVLMGTYAQLGMFRRIGPKQHELAKKCLRALDIEELAQRQISQLSGGQQQRVFLARALAQEAQVYFMDEPFVGVDAKSEQQIINVLNDEKQKGTTMVIVHHDLASIPRYFDYVIMLNQSIKAIGYTKDVFTKENIQKTYGGSLNFMSDFVFD
jgi:manganese/zinc/iron transport system ATP- binding protein